MILLLGSVLLALVAVGWVVHPLLFQRWGLIGDMVPSAVLDGEARKRIALSALRDVEYDRAAGKLDEADYATLRARLEREALEALESAPASAREAAGEAVTHSCGFSNPGGSRFCAGCGQKLG